MLHDILTHNLNRVENINGLLERGKEIGYTENHKDQIVKDANVSPRVVKYLK